MKLLIADRDKKEQIGLEWLVRAYPIPFQEIKTATDFDSLLEQLTQSPPSVCCVELDMVPRKRWEEFRRLANIYTRTIIGMTAEATFDRAVQAIELHAFDLWVKPASPDRIKRSLNRAFRELTETPTERENQSSPTAAPPFSYRSLFIEEEGKQAGTLLLLQPETPESIPSLYRFLEDYPFHHQPMLFPLSDAVAAVYPRSRSDRNNIFQREGYRLIREWSDRSQESLFAVSHHKQDTLSLRQQYRLARQALQLRFYRGNQQWITVEKAIQWKRIDPFLNPEEQRLWVDMLDQSDKEGIKAWMQSEFYNLASPYPDPGLLRIRLTSLLAQLRRFMKSWSLHTQPSLEAHYHRIFSTVLYNPLLYRIVQELLLFVYALLDGAEEQRQRGESDPVERGIRWMEKEFHRPDLSLEQVANHVKRNPSYFSHLLSQQKQVSFRHLLRSIRVRHARRLLETTTLSIQEVARQSGFSHANTFSRIFKKMTGHSPRNYRDQIKNQSSKEKEDLT
ncbi:response regulator transcription factor [Melghirimyces algeriensis]|uniref:Two component transcriptional regulator, AraC family n=1 Tax=Melghirimyces algeriensis TaxID=910412 RepID=A0A521DI88_9BACL|nr:response regulator transcription factor [Melghirimyces algeriensis]SMO71292.1 two component transcriptional regulator, AraC family [Melghirimyces algeriensis]